MVEADVSTIRATLASARVAVVDVWAEWCAPCNALTPKLEALSAQYPAVTWLKVNADQAEHWCSEHGIQGLPAVLMFVNGQCVDGLGGTVTAKKVQAMVERYVK